MRILSVLVLLLIATPLFGMEIRLKESALVEGRMVSLGEIARLMPADEVTAAYADLELFPAPEPGKVRVVKAKEVARYFGQKTLGLDDVRISGAQAVKVAGAGIEMTPAKIEQILKSYLEKKRTLLPRAQVRFKSLKLPPAFFLPRGQLNHQVIPSNARILGSSRFTIIFRVDGRVAKNLSVRGELEAMAPVAVAAHDLGRGIILGEADLKLVEMDISALRNPSFSLHDLLGKKLKRPQRAGLALDRGAVEFPPVIRRGELVTISLKSGALLLTARGEARQDGRQDETIRVRNTSSRKEILCRVVAPGEVALEF